MTEAITKAVTKGQAQANDIVGLLRARTPLIWVVSREEARVERYLFNAAATAKYVPYTWDCGRGVADIAGKVQDGNGGTETMGSQDCGDTLKYIWSRTQLEIGSTDSNRAVWIFRDLHKWLQDPITLRMLRNMARDLPGVGRQKGQSIIILSPSGEVPAELQGDAVVINWSLPDRAELTETLDRTISGAKNIEGITIPTNGVREAVIDSVVGLSEGEAKACFAKSLVQYKAFNSVAIANEKKAIVAKAGVLEWISPLQGGLDAVGGLDVFKGWLSRRRQAFSKKAREFFKNDKSAPKGVLLVGIPGCGKSLSAKAVAAAWGLPLIRMDLGALKSKFVGESEKTIRGALDTIDAIGRCIVWLDELEKAVAGAVDGGADGGVSQDALGTLLTWMQERAGESFVIATCNDITKLPAELYRKGRFDETFFVDLPNFVERKQILRVAAKEYGRDIEIICGDKLDLVSKACEKFTGSEVAEVFKEALYLAFDEGERDVTAGDLISIANALVPLSKTAEARINDLRKMVEQGKAKLATAPLTETSASGQGGLELDI